MKLTTRMKSWITKLGVHVATSDKNGFPTIIVTNSVEINDDYIIVSLTEAQVNLIKNNISESPTVAVAPGQIGSIRAPYQFKGKATLNQNNLEIFVNEIYCTKPGYEAGIRLDTLDFEEIKKFDESRWTDLADSK